MSTEGCYVEVYEDDNFGGEKYRLEGPVEYRNLKNLPGSGGDDFGDKIGSIKVGPKAWVTLYNDEDFKDDSYTFGPDSNVPRLKNDDDTDSIRISDRPL